MACVRKRRDKWVLDYRDGGGRRRWVIFATKEAADVEYGQLLVSGKPPSGLLTVREYHDKWLPGVVPLLKSITFKGYRIAFASHILPIFGDTRLRDIDRGAFRQLLVRKIEGGAKKGTILSIISAFRVMLSQAVEDGHLTHNPLTGIGRRLRFPNGEGKIKAMTAAELVAFLAAGEAGQPPIFLTLARTGMRIGETIALEISDLDFSRRKIRVSKSLSHGELGTTKTGREREVDMSNDLSTALRAYVARRREEAFQAGKPLCPILFSVDGTYQSYNAIRGLFVKALKRAGLPTHFTIHCLRHTFASLLLQNNESPVYVQRMLGHASIRMTVDRYGKWLPTDNLAAVDKLDQLGGK